MIPQSTSTPSQSTYIGIAFYTMSGFPTQWVIVLSSCNRFTRDLLCGTIIEGVNGYVESWRGCPNLCSYDPQCYFAGTIMVGEVKDSAANIKATISTLPWNADEARLKGHAYPPSDEHVCRVLENLDNAHIIRLPPGSKENLGDYLRQRHSLLQRVSSARS